MVAKTSDKTLRGWRRVFAKSFHVTLREAKGLAAETGILRFAQNDTPAGLL